MPARSSGLRSVLFGIAILAIALRLVTVSQPFIDSWSWRQCDVAAIARNYFEHGFRFAWPQIDWAGPAPGYVGTEFPILPFAAAGCYGLTGVVDWVGRSQSVLFFALSLPLFYRLVRELTDATAAGWALFFYSFIPLGMMTSRCFMPDMPSLSLSIGGLYFFIRWLQSRRGLLFVLASLTTSLGILMKLPSVLIGAPMACVALQHLRRQAFRDPAIWLFGMTALLPSALWYVHAAKVARTFYPHHFFGAGGVSLMPLRWYWGIGRRLAGSSLTVTVCVLALAGGWVLVRNARCRMLYAWLAAMIVFVVVAGYGNRHPWYQLPFVPIAAALGGAGMGRLLASEVLSRVHRYAVVALVIIGFAAQSHSATARLMRPAAADLRELGLTLNKVTAPESLVVVADYGDPTALYYAHRKGWHFLEKNGIYNGHPNTSADAIADLRRLRADGATHIAFYSGTVWWLDYYQELAAYLTQNSVSVTAPANCRIFELR